MKTVTEIAKEYNISRQSVLEFVKKGDVDAEMCGRQWLIFDTEKTQKRLDKIEMNKSLYNERMNKNDRQAG